MKQQDPGTPGKGAEPPLRSASARGPFFVDFLIEVKDSAVRRR
jgi:hypothetical protein